jgi:hypothetical protein
VSEGTCAPEKAGVLVGGGGVGWRTVASLGGSGSGAESALSVGGLDVARCPALN